ncbi:MAG TPA: glycosyltransferase family 39 protein [Chloroflexia bacterium]|nr:glycosyltransferase family 39 protein [Chloroflexia bacterium]
MLLTPGKKNKFNLINSALMVRLQARANWLAWGCVAILTVIAFFMRRKGLATQSLWFDEADLLARAQRGLSDILGDFLRPGENGPLYTLFMHYWVKVAGTGEAALRTPSLLAGTATIPMIFALGRKYLGGTAVGLVAAALVTISPYQLWYSQDAKMYPLAMLCTLASVYLFLTALKQGSRGWWIAYVVFTTLSFYIHLMSVLIVGVEVLYYLLSRPSRASTPRLYKRRSVIALCLLTLPYLPIAVWQARALWDGGIGKTWFQPVGLLTMLDTLGRRFGVNRIDNYLVETLGALFFAILALLGLLVVWRSSQKNQFSKEYSYSDGRNQESPVLDNQALPGSRWAKIRYVIQHNNVALLLTLYLVLPVLAFYLLTMRIPVFADRYLLIASPAYYLLVAWGLVWLGIKFWPVALLGGVATLVFAGVALFSFNYSDTPQKEDWRESMRWLQSQLRPGDEIIVLPGYLKTAVDYYLKPGDVPVYTIPQDLIDGHDDPALVSYLSAENGIIRNHERAWIITSPERYIKDDPKEYVKKVWFDNNTWTFHDPKVYLGVTIYGYTFKQIPGTNADYYPPEAGGKTSLKFGSSLQLEGFNVVPVVGPDRSQASYDQYLHLTLYWRKIAPDDTDYEMTVRLLDKNGQDTGTNYTAQPLAGYYPTGKWKVHEAVRDYRDLYIHVPPGQYRLEITAYPAGQPEKALTVSGNYSGKEINSSAQVQHLVLDWTVNIVEK